MAEMSQTAPARVGQSALGVFFVVLGMALITVQDGFMKEMLERYSLWPLMVSRGVMGVVICVPLILIMGGANRLSTPLLGFYAIRGALIAVAFALFYAAFPFMNLAEISTIFFAAPLMITIMATIFLGETIGPHRIFALVLGFGGVLIALNPTAEAFQPVALLPFFCAILYAASQIVARKMGDGDTLLMTALFTVLFMALAIPLVGGLTAWILPEGPETHHVRWDWAIPQGMDLLWVALLGISGMAGITFLTRGYQVASASLLAPFDYTYLPMATGMAYFLWDEVPTRSTLIGMALIVAAGLYLAWRESR